MKRACFTLIELLVVMAMILLLLGIFIPVLSSIRQRARAILCRSRIRQVTLDLIMYDTNNETFPYSFINQFTEPPGGFVGDATKDKMGWWWFHLMEGYNETKKKLLLCPSKSLDNPSLKNNLLYGNYGLNQSICTTPGITKSLNEFAGAPLSKDQIPQPERTLLIVDCGYSVTNWWHATDIPPVLLEDYRGGGTAYIPGLTINKEKHLMPGQDRDAVDGRHPNKTVNVGFVGGNVDRKQANDFFVEKRLDGYRDKSPLWVPE
ncbi:MAG: type II secretion system protein [Sedimentisphaerales bacterium]|nr:type II secretion system protein [Sedimentisphaerales bacterium]